MNEKKIILNYLPPATIYYPSSGLSILKSFLQLNNFQVDIKYWNFLLNSIITGELDEDIIDIEIKLMPFNAILAEETNDIELYNKILAYLHKSNPEIFFDLGSDYKLYIEEIKNKALEIITTELDKIDFKNILLFGISYKLYQWIPGIILAKEVKKRSPETKIVMGGFERKETATELMNLSSDLDFAIWGEGEYPLLDLCEQLKNNQESYEQIARFIYRKDNKIVDSLTNKSKYLDFDNYIFPNYDDFALLKSGIKIQKNIHYPFHSIRSCHWKKCKFCNYSEGYKYRERTPQNIIEEIEYLSKTYEAEKFMFVDNDIIGTGIERFDEFLNLLIKSNSTRETVITLWCEMIPHSHLNEEIIKKMAIAGFTEIFVGYESISDSLLKKMNKSNDFALNILVVKSALKHGMNIKTNLIKGIPDETKEDVLESINNLHYLRFYFNAKPLSLYHIHGAFALYREAKYYKSISESEIKQYDSNPTSYYVPESLIKPPSILFGYLKKTIDNASEWSSFSSIENIYRERPFTYKVIKTEEKVYYSEYVNNEKKFSVEFTEPEYVEVLKITNDKVCSFEELQNTLKKKYSDISDEKIIEILQNLNTTYLLYFNEDKTRIIS